MSALKRIRRTLKRSGVQSCTFQVGDGVFFYQHLDEHSFQFGRIEDDPVTIPDKQLRYNFQRSRHLIIV